LETALGTDRITTRGARAKHLRSRLWREWSFWRAAGQRVWVQGAVLVALLVGGAMLFRAYEPEKNHSLPEAVYFTWSLIFGEPPEAFPRDKPMLQVLFFAVPVVGMLVIIQGLLELSVLVGDRRHNERAWCKVMASQLRNHIILVGVGRLGYRTFHLLRKLGEDVAVIEVNASNQFLEDVRRDGSPLFIGDARRETLLIDANVAKAKSVIVATDDDLANLEIALDARKLNPDVRVILRLFDQNMADKIREGFGIRFAMSTSAISAPGFALKAVAPSIVSNTMVGDTLVVTVRWNVRTGGPLCGLTVADVMRKLRSGIMERTSRAGERTLFPSPDTVLQDGDEVLVQGPFDEVTVLEN
jgi:Trk K+ transport system NAD-binding subunit